MLYNLPLEVPGEVIFAVDIRLTTRERRRSSLGRLPIIAATPPKMSGDGKWILIGMGIPMVIVARSVALIKILRIPVR